MEVHFNVYCFIVLLHKQSVELLKSKLIISVHTLKYTRINHKWEIKVMFSKRDGNFLVIALCYPKF